MIIKHGTLVLRSFLMVAAKICFFVKDTHREKTCSNETPVLTNSMNVDIWFAGTSNQLYIRGS